MNVSPRPQLVLFCDAACGELTLPFFCYASWPPTRGLYRLESHSPTFHKHCGDIIPGLYS